MIHHRRLSTPEPDARVFAIQAALGEWILVFDPDMRLKPGTCRVLRQIAQSGDVDIVDFYCRNNYLGRWCVHGHGSQPVFRKFFRKSVFKPNPRNIHTFWHDSTTGRVLRLPADHAILHFSYSSVEGMCETFGRYAVRQAADFLAQGRRPSVTRMVWRPLKRLLGNYILRRGFLDGVPGLIVNLSVSGYIFLTEAHLWDLHRRSNRRSGESLDGVRND